jgi:hypothetical protein
MSGYDSITLAPAPFVKNAVIKCGSGSRIDSPRSVKRALSLMQGFKSQGAMHAHRYNGQPDGTHMAPPSGGGMLPREHIIPATAVYVVWSYNTPIAWVDHDNRVTVPDVFYSVITRHHQNLCRTYIPSAQ